MFGILVFSAEALLLFVRFLLYPVGMYFMDPKGLRKYPNMSLLSGMTNIPFMLEAGRGFRSKRLAELHKTHPVIRIGPNSLSYGKARAIKGHLTKCTKDDMYNLLSGSHYHLADVIDKGEHQRKRKTLSNKISRLAKQFDQHCAIAINNAMPMLLKHPDALRKLREEIDSIADEGEIAISYSKVKDLPYLRACLDESMQAL
ncbi:hypothetical protein BJX64DRAFT_286083 [Aspergillus heterothallicus]